MDDDRIVSVAVLIVGFIGIAIGCSGKGVIEPAVGALMVLFVLDGELDRRKMSRTRG